MPFMENRDIRLHYQVEGREDAPWLVLSNSLGTGIEMWQPQVPALLEHFRLLRYDMRGHGKSSVPPGPYSIAQLGEDVIFLLDHLNIESACFCGLSMGGMIGMWLGIHHPQRFARLVLCNTGARIGTQESWNERIAKVRQGGMTAIASTVLDRWFTADFQRYAPSQVELVRAMLLLTAPEGYAANCAAVRDMDLRAELGRIGAPTLVIAGRHDTSTPPEEGQRVAEAIPGARYVEFNAAHLSNWEAAQSFTNQVIDFLRQAEPPQEGRMHEQQRHDQGMTVRRAVLGNAHVERAQAKRTALTTEFQDLITRYAWGEIWTRPGLPRHTRSLLTIMAMVALNREEELKLHLRAAANNNVSQDEIREVLMQAAIYCGVPAANSAFKMAQEIFDQQEQGSP
jgi:3-oxoadipate enol-lactonase/4-carboxymuconolactone decarboxylase